MSAGCRNPIETELKFVREVTSFGIEIEKHFHVVGNESDRHDHDICRAFRFRLSQSVKNVWPQPRGAG